MAAIPTAGYQDLRDYIQANWTFIEVRDTTGAAILRVGGADARVSWVHAAGSQTLQRRIVITGSDADVPVPVTARSTAIFKVASGGSAMSVETLVEGDATISADADNITITHNIQVPQV